MIDIRVFTIQEVRENAIPVYNKISKKYEDTNYFLDIELAKKIIGFISMLKHTGGNLGGINFQLLPFQVEFIIETLAVLSLKTRLRKHKTSILFVSRKNGKTELLSAINLWMLFGDAEKQKEQYVLASETQQASILYNAIVAMIKQAPILSAKCTVFRSTKTVEKNNTEFRDIFKVLTSNAESKDGFKASCTTSDEAHAYRDSSLYDVMNESMAHRDAPLSIVISTAGYNQQGFFKRMVDYAVQVSEGIIENDSYYIMHLGIKEGEDWSDEEVWKRCNPALGYGVKIDYLRDKFLKAQHSGDDEVSFRTKHLCQWTNAATVWIKDEVWTANQTKPITLELLRGRTCYGGLDLSSTTDISALVLVFPNSDGSIDVIRRYWIPEDNMRERARKDRVPYIDWHRDGHILSTVGNVIDYDFIEKEIIELSEIVQIETLHYDRWNSANLANHLVDNGINAVGFGQGFASMSNPTKMIETLALQNKINHENDPVLRWMCSNILLQTDSAGNLKIDKAKSRERVDGQVALAMAIGAWLINKPKETSSPYESGEIRFI